MKRILTVLIITVLIQGCNKSNTAGSGTVTDSTVLISARGAALAPAISKQIDQKGGSIISADGVVELVFPAGALKTATTIGVQPISNFCFDSSLTAYRLTPDGLTFDKKPTLIFHYPDSALNGTYADLLGIAFQDSTGAWNAMTRTVIDSVNKKISVAIPHFSDWFFFPYMCIRPAAAKVKVGATRELGVTMLKIPEDTSELARPIISLNKLVFKNWAVNGIPTGNDIIGNIAPETSKGRYALYGAPAELPDPATVSVSVEVPYENSKRLLFAKITVYDTRYDVKITQDNPIGFEYLYQMHDEASYSVLVKKDGGSVINIKNQAPVLTKIPGQTQPCTEEINPFDGSVNVVNPIAVSVSADNMITASFPPTVKSSVTSTITCPGAPQPVTNQYPIDVLNGSVTFAKTDKVVQMQQTKPDGAVITYTITPVNK